MHASHWKRLPNWCDYLIYIFLITRTPDVDDYAAREEVSTEEYFEKVKNRVGALGHFGLHLVHSEMDEAWHIVVGPTEENS